MATFSGKEAKTVGFPTSNKATHFAKEHFRGKTVLYHAPEMKALAEEICRTNKHVILGDIRWGRFDDSFPDCRVNNAPSLKYAHVSYLASLHSPEVIFEQLALIYAFPRLFCKSFDVILPFFPTGTMERVTEYGEIATAKTLARMLSTIPLSRNGPCTIHIFDIHTLQNQFYFSDNVFVRLHKAAGLLKQQLNLLKRENIAIAFPDEGAMKRFSTSFHEYPIIVCHKTRDGNDRIVKVKEGECTGKHVIIVDDLIQSGGTLVSCADACRKEGASTVSAFVTHAILPNQAWKKFVHTPEKKGAGDLDYFWVTNSHPTAAGLAEHPPFSVLSIAPLINQHVLTIHQDYYQSEKERITAEYNWCNEEGGKH